MTFDRLGEVRSACRARAVEDFEFFALTVCGLHVQPELCRALQLHESVSLQGLPQIVRERLFDALCVWEGLVAGREVPQGVQLSETFTWLFAEELGRAA